MKKTLLSVFCMALFFINKAEGTKEAMPDSANGTAMYLATSILSGPYFNCPVDQRLRFNIKDFNTERLYFGLQARDRSNATPPLVTNMYYRIVNPIGTVVAGPTLISSTAGGNGFIQHYSQAVAGPNIANATPAGYTPISYTPVMNGDFYIEIYRSADGGATQVAQASLNNSILLVYFDFTVATAANIKFNGRIHCNKWGFITYVHSKPPTTGAYAGDITKSFSGDFYGYTADSIICKVNFQPLFKPLAFNLAMTKYGVIDNGNWINDRRSIYTNSTSSPALSGGYKVFLNQPDLTVFPTSALPNSPVYKTIYGCPGAWNIVFSVDNTGDVQILLDLNGTAGYQAGTADRILLAINTVPGDNTIAWDGKDGLGNTVAAGTAGSFLFSLQRGRTNIPMYDAETNANGFSVDGILPSAFSTKLYWCDTALNITTNNTCPATPTAAENADNNNTGIGVDNSIAGTTGITHAWNGAGANFNTPAATGTDGSASTNLCDDFGNARTINTWFWPTVSTAANFTVTVPTGCITLASDKLNLTAAIQQNDVAVQWVTVNETNYKQFEVQRSSDGINFTTIATQNATISGSDKNYYNYIDKNVSNKVFYRIKVITITDAVSYSKVICVQTLATNNLSTMVYPNPVDPTSALSFRLTKKENLKLSINNTAGAVLVIFTINGAAGANQLALSDYTAKLLPGIYYITLQGQSGKAIQKIIKL